MSERWVGKRRWFKEVWCAIRRHPAHRVRGKWVANADPDQRGPGTTSLDGVIYLQCACGGFWYKRMIGPWTGMFFREESVPESPWWYKAAKVVQNAS